MRRAMLVRVTPSGRITKLIILIVGCTTAIADSTTALGRDANGIQWLRNVTQYNSCVSGDGTPADCAGKALDSDVASSACQLLDNPAAAGQCQTTILPKGTFPNRQQAFRAYIARA